MIKGAIHSTESFGSVDGPGIRFVIFLKGCRMRCRFCHNPDTWDTHSDDMRSSDELLEQALRYRSYWGKDGGITVSGGEPLLQIDFLIELFSKAKQFEIHTCIDTCGKPFNRNEVFLKKFDTLMQLTDLVMLDIKHIDNEKHKWLTSLDNSNILDCARYLDSLGKSVWIRHVYLPGISDEKEEYLYQLRDFIKSLSNVKKVELLPYHNMGVYKWEQLGLEYTLNHISPPSEEEIEHAKNILEIPFCSPVP